MIHELAEDREQGIEWRDEDGGIAGVADDRVFGGREIGIGRRIHIRDQSADDARRSVDDVEGWGVVVAEKHPRWKAGQGLVIGGGAIANDDIRHLDEGMIGDGECVGIDGVAVLIDEIRDVQRIIVRSSDVADAAEIEGIKGGLRPKDYLRELKCKIGLF